MTPKNPTKGIRIHNDVFNRLMTKAHFGQTINGVIKELLDTVDEIDGTQYIHQEQPTRDRIPPVTKTAIEEPRWYYYRVTKRSNVYFVLHEEDNRNIEYIGRNEGEIFRSDNANVKSIEVLALAKKHIIRLTKSIPDKVVGVDMGQPLTE